MEQSGNHDDGEEVDIANFTKSTLMQYFHTFLDDPKNAGVFEKSHGDLQDDVRFEIGQRKIENKRKSKRWLKSSIPQEDSMKEYTKAFKVSRGNKPTTKNFALSVPSKCQKVFERLAAAIGGQQLEDKIPDTPERMIRIRQHKERNQPRGGEDDDNSVEAYADIMDRMQYYIYSIYYHQKRML